MKLGFDCDGVLANFNHAYGDLIVKLTKRDVLPKEWKTDPNFPSTWNWDTGAGYSDEELSKVWKFIKDPVNNFWGNLPCLIHPDLRHNIMEIAWSGHDVYFITNRPGADAKLRTEQWLRYNGFADCPTVLIAEDKPPIIKSLDLDFYIDDRLITMNNLHDFYRSHRIKAEDKHLYLLDAPYNREGRSRHLKVVNSVKEGLEHAGLWKELR